MLLAPSTYKNTHVGIGNPGVFDLTTAVKYPSDSVPGYWSKAVEGTDFTTMNSGYTLKCLVARSAMVAKVRGMAGVKSGKHFLRVKLDRATYRFFAFNRNLSVGQNGRQWLGSYMENTFSAGVWYDVLMDFDTGTFKFGSTVLASNSPGVEAYPTMMGIEAGFEATYDLGQIGAVTPPDGYIWYGQGR